MLSKVMFPCILGDGKIVLEDEPDMTLNNGLSLKENGVPSKRPRTITHPVDLELEVVLGKMPRKVFDFFFLKHCFLKIIIQYRSKVSYHPLSCFL